MKQYEINKMKQYEINKKDVNNVRYALNNMYKSVCTSLVGGKGDDYWTFFGKGVGEISVSLNPYHKNGGASISITSANEKGIRRIKKNLIRNKINLGNLVKE